MRRYSRKKNSTKIFVALTIAAAVVFAASNFLMTHRNDVVIAKVNDETIYKSEVERKLRSVFDGQNLGGASAEIKVPEVESLPKEVLEILVKEVYLDKELTKRAEKSKAAQNQDVKDRIEDAKSRIVRQAYIDSIVKDEITDQKVSDKYAELSNELNGKKEYQVSHIVAKTKEEAEALLKELKSKKAPKFADLAKKKSIDSESAEKGGDLGYILEDNMIKEIAEVVSTAKKDEISGPIQTRFGWHLVKVSDIRESKALPFESVKENIREQLAQDMINNVNAEITKDAKIQILVELKEAAPKPEEIKADDQQPAADQPAEQKPEVTLDNGETSATEPAASVTPEANAAEVKSEEKAEETPAEEKTEEKKVEKKSDAKKQKAKSKQKNNR